MDPELEVDFDALRSAAADVHGTAARVAAAPGGEPVVPAVPRWAAVDAAALAGDVARRLLTLLGDDIAETAHRLGVSAEQYELADARAVARLRLGR